MKLLHKSLKNYVLFSIIIYIISLPVFYIIIQDLWLTDVDESLMYQKEKIVNALINDNFNQTSIDNFTKTASQFELGVSIIPLSGNKIATDTVYTNNQFDNTRKHVEPFRELISVIEVKGKWYKFTLQKDLVENADLISAITTTQAILLLFLLVGLLIQTNHFSKKTWQPFYTLITKLKTYKIDAETPIEVQSSNIDEFNELNYSVKKLTENNIHVFRLQKEFTENAAHETQTPLAAIKNQVDILAQDKELTENQSEIVYKIDRNIRLLTKLNRNLLLLSKIDNDQFRLSDSVEIASVINEIIQTFGEQIKLKGIAFNCKEDAKPILISNSQLIFSLFTNLLTNAVKYNVKDGKIQVILSDNQFQIINTGISEPLPEDKIYKRFYKNSQLNESSGLGLAIAKRICDSLSFEMNYEFLQPDMHSFTIFFNQRV